MSLKLKITILLLFISSYTLLAQNKEVTNQSLYWIRYYNQLSLNKKWVLHNEIDERRFFVKNKHQHLIMHSRLHYKFLESADVAFGFTYSLQSPQDPNAKTNLVVPELRPNQEINFNHPINNRLSIQQRLRVDERFISKNNGVALLDGYDFNFRFRYRIQAKYNLTKLESPTQTILKVSDELMINAGENTKKNTFDQNRVYIALEKEINKNFSVELGYLYWYQKRMSGYQFFDRDIIRFTIYHKMKL
jgi:hypothetical protein